MTYQQWNQFPHYQAIPEARPYLQPWQQEIGCPVPRPRSFSLGSRPTGTDLLEVSSKRVYNASPIFLPVDSNQNYCYKSTNSSPKRQSNKRRYIWMILLVLLATFGLSMLAWWKMRLHASSQLKDSSQPPPPPPFPPSQPQQQNYQQHAMHQPHHVPQNPQHQQHHHQQYQQQQQYHPLPPPPSVLMPSQQQHYAQQPSWQQQSVPQHQYQQQVPPADAHHQQYNHNSHPQQQHVPPPQHSYSHQYPPQYSHAQHHAKAQEIPHHQGEQAPRKSWMMDHMDSPAKHPQDIRYQHQQQYQPEEPRPQQRVEQQQQQPEQHYQVPPEPILNRQEERAKARNQARTLNPAKNSTKTQTDDDIWEEKNVSQEQMEDVTVNILKLRVELPLYPYNESVVGSDGTMILTSYEDDEDVTVEVVEDI